MNTNPNNQLPDEVVATIKTQAKEYAAGLTFNSAWTESSHVSEFCINAGEDWEAGATEYATKLHQVLQEKEEERQQRVHLEKENDILTNTCSFLKKENSDWKEECERLSKVAEHWQQEYYKLNPPRQPMKIDNNPIA